MLEEKQFILNAVSKSSAAMANQTAACLAAFGNCRKTQDVAGAAISTCEQLPDSLTSKMKQLTTNKDLVNSAQAHPIYWTSHYTNINILYAQRSF
jgi:hypothetical protein